MLTSPIGLIYRDPVGNAIIKHKKEFPFIESENELNTLKYKDSIKYLHLYGMHCAGDKESPFDLSKHSEQLAQYLPKCEFFHVWHMHICNFRIECTTIKKLMIVCPQPHGEKWELNCPNFVDFDMQNHTPPVKNFQRALINSSQIETFFFHKYWTREPLPALYLPNCTDFTFRQGDNTNSIKLHLPKVEYLTLDGCFNLNDVELLTQGDADHAKWNMAPGSELSKLKLSLTNGNISATALKSFEDYGRVTVWKTWEAQGDAHAVMYAVMEIMH